MQYLKSKLTYIIVFFVLTFCSLSLLAVYKDTYIANFLAMQTAEAKAKYESTVLSPRNTSNLIFTNIINKKNVIDIFKLAYKADEENREAIRDELYKALIASYKDIKQYNIQQLHFHLPDNASFLRFHRPQKFGDDLTEVRSTVAHVNKYKRSIEGFEEGKIFNAYRFVYPLFDENNIHIGSVEVSHSTNAFKELFERSFSHIHVDFVMHKDVVQQKLFTSELKNYVPYELSDSYVRQTSMSISKELRVILELMKGNKEIPRLMERGEDFSIDLQHDDHYGVASYIGVHNAVTHKLVGYTIIVSQSAFLTTFYKNYQIQQVIVVLAALFLVIILYLGVQYSIKLREEKHNSMLESQRIKGIIDSSKNIVVLIHGEKLVFVNHSFLVFFQTTLEECIEQKVVDYLKHESIDVDTLGDKTWVEHYLELPSEKQHLVLETSQGVVHEFVLSVTQLESASKEWVIVLTDITQMSVKNKQLQIEANVDKLTQIYNRNYFEKILESQFELLGDEVEKLSLIMFDIDNFKKINDTYGHDVGDRALVGLADIVTHCIRTEDIFARWGGEEFMVLVETDLDIAVKIAEHLRHDIEEKTKELDQVPQFTCSFGVVELTGLKAISIAYKLADTRLYIAKKAGRNKVVSSSIMH